MPSFYQIVNEAIADIREHGFDSLGRIQQWAERIRLAARASLVPQVMLEKTLRITFERAYTSLITKGGYTKVHKGIPRFGVERLTPKLQEMLAQRTAMSSSLIRLNRDRMIERTEQRFQGWASSVPPGGSKATDTKEARQDIGKALKSLPFEERRVMIDQGHKFVSNLNEVIAMDNNAIAVIWHSHWRQAGYNYRKDHKERDLQVYLLKDSWAAKAGFIKVGPAGYYDAITKPAEEPFCRCSGQYLYTLGAIPEDMLTEKGKAELLRVRNVVSQIRKSA